MSTQRSCNRKDHPHHRLGNQQSRSDARRPRKRSIGDVRAPRLWPALIVVSLLTFGALLYVTGYMNFFWDEWDFVTTARPWNINVFLLPHAEHWSTIPILIWKVLFLVVGIRTHIPYEAALLIGHLGAVLLLFTFIRRRSGDVSAFAAALVLLLLGGGG